MPGFGDSRDTGQTPGRFTRIRFGRWRGRLVQPAFALRRTYDAVASSSTKLDKTELIPGIGISLKPVNFDRGELHAAGAELSGTVPAAIESLLTYRQDSLVGVTYSGGLTQSFALYRKRVAAGGTFDAKLTSDQTAFPGPANSSTTDLDRVFASTADHDPQDMVSFTVTVPFGPTLPQNVLARFYFCGPASNRSTSEGTGQMCLQVHGGGLCSLYELKTDGAWTRRDVFEVRVVPGTMIDFDIVSNCRETEEGWRGTSMTIRTTYLPGEGGNPLINTLANTAINAIQRAFGLGVHRYKVPLADQAETVPNKIRVDVRREVRALFQAYDVRYPDSGTVVDQIVALPFFAAAGGTLRADIYCYRPTGTALTAVLKNAETGTTITGTVVIDDAAGVSIDFAIPSGAITSSNSRRFYQMTLTLTADGPNRRTPTLDIIGYFMEERREAVGSELIDFPLRATAGTGPKLLKRAVQMTSVTGESDEPTTSAAVVQLSDLTGEATEIRDKAGQPIDIEILDGAGNILTRVFRGEVASIETRNIRGRTRAGAGDPYPGAQAWQGQVACQGEWARLNRQLSVQQRLALTDDVDQTQMLKVTDGIKRLFYAAGISSTELDVPDLAVRFLGDPDDPLTIEADTRLSEVILQVNRDYIGGIIVRDENASTTPATPNTEGIWRLLTRPKAPFRPLLRFTNEHPGALKLPHVLSAYDVDTAGDGQLIQHVPVREVRTRVTPPEGNVVVVIGGMSAGSEKPEQLVQIAVNVRSFNALGLATSHPSFPDPYDPDTLYEYTPIVVRDATLSRPEAVNWVCRRTFEAACYSYKTRRFTAPLPLIVDVADPLQTRARIPRVGDICEYLDEDGVFRKYAIVKCDPEWRRAHHMTATFEIVRSKTIDSYDFVNPAVAWDYRRAIQRIVKRTRDEMGMQAGWSMSWEQNRTISTQKGAWASLPAQTISPIQDLDPSSVTFGEFIAPAGYE